MSATINSIPASQIVSVVPSVVNAGGAGLDLIELMLTTNPRFPIGQVLSFPSQAAVASYAGATSLEAIETAVYFGGFIGATKLPGAVLFAQYPAANVGAYLRGGSVAALTLTQLQALAGVITITIDGTPHTSSSINLSSATSFSSAAALITTGLGLTGPTVASVTGSFGASSTGSGSGTNLTLSSTTGVIHPGTATSASISGTGVPANTYIVSQTSGTTGGDGVYVTNNATTSSGATITVTSTTADITAIGSGTLAVGQELTGTSLSTTTYISSQTSGTPGGIGVYVTTAAHSVGSETITAVTPVVSYDSISGGFVIISSTTGASSTIGYATGTLAAPLNLTSATGAVLSQGAAATTPGAFMASVIGITTDWATFQTIFDPDNGSGNTNKLAFAAWVNSTGNRYAYLCTDTDITATQSTAATGSLGYTLKASGSSGTIPLYQPVGGANHLAAFVGGFAASLNFEQTNGRATLAFRGQSGLVPSVTDATSATNLLANDYVFYGAYATANQAFRWMYNGQITGLFSWADSYLNQIWFNNACQLALMEMLGNYLSIPYNPVGYGYIRAALMDPINAALNFGAIRANVPLSSAQASEVNAIAGMKVDDVLGTRGWYLVIQPATAQVRALRNSPTIILLYMDGQSVQRITLSSILVQ